MYYSAIIKSEDNDILYLPVTAGKKGRPLQWGDLVLFINISTNYSSFLPKREKCTYFLGFSCISCKSWSRL